MSKGDPIPTRFGPKEEEAIETLHGRTGLSRAEIVRRAMRLLARRYKQEGNAGFIIEELAPTIAEAEPAYRLNAPRKIYALIITDAAGRTLEINQAFTDMCGYTLEDLYGEKPGHKLQGPDTDPKDVQKLREAVREGKPCDCTILNYDSSQRPYLVHIMMEPVYEHGELVRFRALEEKV